MWKNNYRRLFEEVPGLAGTSVSGKAEKTTLQTTDASVSREGGGNSQHVVEEENLVFKFQPDLTGLLNRTSAPEGSDGWALDEGAVSVTPLLTSFAEIPESEQSFTCLQDREWKLKV